MKQRKIRSATVAAFAVLALTEAASAYYSPRLGRFLIRDPIGEPGAVLIRQEGQLASRSTAVFIPRDPADEEAREAFLYAFVENTPTNTVDPEGLSPFPQHEYAEEIRCCKCLAYSEAGGKPACLGAVVHIMRSRQHSGWSDFNGESSFCAQAHMRKRWAGGAGNQRYDQCDQCTPLPPLEQAAADAADRACSNAVSGSDPTDGAQFHWSKGRTPDWMKKQAKTGNCSRVTIPDCPLEIWKCKKRPVAG